MPAGGPEAVAGFVFLWVGARTKKRGRAAGPAPKKTKSGGALLSHTLSSAVPSPCPGLTSRFGMGTGCLPGAMAATRTLFAYQRAACHRGMWTGKRTRRSTLIVPAGHPMRCLPQSTGNAAMDGRENDLPFGH